jgi:H+-translocating NAD(P) transhydrogenase subunit alpha
MMIKQILVVKETREGESRVALTPETISSLSSRQYRLLVETNAGLKAGFTDSDYIKAGADIFVLSTEEFPPDTLILRVKRPDKAREDLENKCFQENTFMMGFLDPFDADNHVLSWQNSGITTFSVDLFKSLPITDPKNMQAAMSRIAGRLAFQDGLKYYKGEKPVKLAGFFRLCFWIPGDVCKKDTIFDNNLITLTSNNISPFINGKIYDDRPFR